MLPIVTLVVGMLASVGTLFFVRRAVGYGRLAASNEVAAAFFTTVGTIYAVILAFIVCACLFGVPNGRIHAFQTAMLAGLLVFVLYAVGEMKHPFEGRVHVEPTSFRVSIEQMQQP